MNIKMNEVAKTLELLGKNVKKIAMDPAVQKTAACIGIAGGTALATHAIDNAVNENKIMYVI